MHEANLRKWGFSHFNRKTLRNRGIREVFSLTESTARNNPNQDFEGSSMEFMHVVLIVLADGPVAIPLTRRIFL